MPRWEIAGLAALIGAIAMAALSTTLTKADGYGMAVFLTTPAVGGYLSSALLRISGKCSLAACMLTSASAYMLCGVMMLGTGQEGVICLILAAPLGAGFLVIGALAAHAIHHGDAPKIPPSAPILFVALTVAMDLLAYDSRDVRTVESSILVDASPEEAWRSVVALRDVSAKDDWVFRTGIAAPVRCELYGSGVGAKRVCTVTTGQVPEVVTAWRPGEELSFRALATPAPMKEVNPFWEVDPPHLHGYYEVLDGSFLIRPEADGRTRVSRVTRFSSKLRPFAYWSKLCEFAADRGHQVVLRKLKEDAENRSTRVARLPLPPDQPAADGQ